MRLTKFLLSLHQAIFQHMKSKRHYLYAELQKRGLKITWVETQIGLGRGRLSQYFTHYRTMPEEIEQKIKDLLSI